MTKLFYRKKISNEKIAKIVFFNPTVKMNFPDETEMSPQKMFGTISQAQKSKIGNLNIYIPRDGPREARNTK